MPRDTEPPCLERGLIPRATVVEICAKRRAALALYGEAFEALSIASAAFEKAKAAHNALMMGHDRYTHHGEEAKEHFMNGIKLPEGAAFEKTARKLVDTDVWSTIIKMTDLERLMDKTAKDQLSQQLLSDPPEITEENVRATVQRFILDADMIFKRGIATCFSNLDRRFRSHDGWKIGSRIILDRAFNEWGHWNYYGNQRDTILDVERTFAVLDGVPNYGSAVWNIEFGRRGHHEAHRSEHETQYFKVRCFKNGNAHLWFKRDDLVEKVNKLLGEYYGAPIPEERDPNPDTGLHDPKTTLAKNYGFYPTPEDTAQTVLERVPLYRDKDNLPRTVLEPSAGTGNLAKLAVEKGAIVDCIEIHPERAAGLEAAGLYRSVKQADFLAVLPGEELYDVVLMNPPFDRERDIDHVMHALKFLKPTGCLVAVMSAGTEFRETRKATAFRELMKQMNARWHDLPAGSFASVGTYMNTVVLRVWNDRHRQYY